MRVVAAVAAVLLCALIGFGAEKGPYAGLSLDEVLRLLQDRGLRIVFSSALVRPEMVVLGSCGLIAEVTSGTLVIRRDGG